jgi:hypothetical protein
MLIMKKKILGLGSALMLFLNLNTANADVDDFSFGLKGGGSLFMAPISDAKLGGAVDYEGKVNLFVQGGLFANYRLLDDMMSVGLEAGYSRKGFILDKKEAKSDEKNQNKDDNKKSTEFGVHTHAIDIAIPVAFLPMGREGGLSIFLGPKVYFPVSNQGKEPGSDESKKLEKEVIRSFNIGGTAGINYEIAESGFFVGANYDYFFLDIFADHKDAEVVKAILGKKKEDSFNLHGAQVSIGYDFARLME